MKSFLRSFIQFFTRPFPYIRKHLWYSLLVLAVNFVFYAGLILLVNRLFEAVWIENIFQRITEKSIYLRPLYFLNQLTGNPLLHIMQPLMLYVAYSLAFALSTIITGSILGFLSRSVEKDLEYNPPFVKSKGGIVGFFKDLKEELFMLGLTICWSGVLFFIAIIPNYGIPISLILFYLITPLFHGAYNLSYYFMRWGFPYTSMYRSGFRRFFSFYGFSMASASGFFIILLMLKAVPYNNLVFALLFGLNALFRPFGVISGTLTGIDYSKEGNKNDRPEKGRFGKGLTVIAFCGALLFLFTGAQFYVQSQSKLDLIDCRFTLKDARINLPENMSKKSLLGKIMGVASFVQDARLKVQLEVQNPTRQSIHLEDFVFDLKLSGRQFSRGKITGFTLKPGRKNFLSFSLKLNSLKLGYSLVKSLIKQTRLKLTMQGWISLQLWFGKLTYPVKLIK